VAPEPGGSPCAKEGPFRAAGVERPDGQAGSLDAGVFDWTLGVIGPDPWGDGPDSDAPDGDEPDEDFSDLERYREGLRARVVPGPQVPTR
jgi:hypothetical protein